MSVIGPNFKDSLIDSLLGYNSNSGRESSAKRVLGRDDFLKLFVAQMKEQDPLNPIEGSDLSVQLAQFSSLEQLFNIDQHLIDISKKFEIQEKGHLLDYIGKTVKARGDMLQVKDGDVSTGYYSIDDSADVTIFIYNTNGEKIRTLYQGRKESGEHSFEWDGRDDNGNKVNDGNYIFEISGKDTYGYPVSADTYLYGRVTGITYQNRIPYLMLGDNPIGVENVLEVKIDKGEEGS